jgi:predicted permease
MGASRGRIVRQLLTENAVLAAAGGLVGVGLGRAELKAIVALLPDTMPRWIGFQWDARFAAFCLLVTAAAALLFGLIPAWQASRADVRSTLHEAGARSSASVSRRRMLNGLVVAEVGLAVALLVSSGLLLRAFHKVTHLDPGFRPENVLTFAVDLPEQKYPKVDQTVDFYRRLVDQVRALPGVTASGAATAPPLGGHWGQFFVGDADPPLGPNDKTPVVLQVAVTPGYFDAIGMTLEAGRWFDAHDGLVQHGVAIVNETFARQHWPAGNAVGKRIKYQYGNNIPWWDVVGVVRNEKHYGLDGEDRPAVYTPDRQLAFPMKFTVVARTASNPEALTEPARRILARMDADLPMYGVHTMTAQLDQSLWTRRAYSWLFGAFAAVALLLAAAGTYGVLSYAVAQRTQEIGIRMALGASPGEVLGAVLRGGMALVAAGAIFGVAATAGAAKLMEKLLFGVSPHEPVVYGAGLLVVTAVGALAIAIPARRAAGMDAVKALKG